MSEPQTAPNAEQKVGVSWRFRTLITVMVVTVAALCLVGGVVWALIRRLSGSAPAVTPTLPPTMDITPTPTWAATMEDILYANGEAVPLGAPDVLDVGGVPFQVHPVKIESGTWSPLDVQHAASWVYGTVINYVMGIQATQDNVDLLDAQQIGHEFVLHLATGGMLHFGYRERLDVAAGDVEPFRQTEPGLTLVLLDEPGATRTVFKADYVPGRDLGLEMAGRPFREYVPVGETADLEGLRLGVTGVRQVFADGDLPPGTAYMIIDFSLSNRSGQAFDTATLMHGLRLGQQTIEPMLRALPYATYPPLSGLVQDNESVSASAVYQVPYVPEQQGFWLCAIGDSKRGLSVPVDVAALPGEVAARANAGVAVNGVMVEGSLHLTVTVQNESDTPFYITSSDVIVETTGRPAELQALWPWKAAAQSESSFLLAVVGIEDEHASMVELMILNRRFQLGW